MVDDFESSQWAGLLPSQGDDDTQCQKSGGGLFKKISYAENDEKWKLDTAVLNHNMEAANLTQYGKNLYDESKHVNTKLVGVNGRYGKSDQTDLYTNRNFLIIFLTRL